MRSVRLPFSHAGLAGMIDVQIASTEVPAAIGAWPHALGLANCEAVIDFPGRGYMSLFGWIQVVRSTDNSSGGADFEMDPLTVLGDVSHPFCFFGIRPTLFDAPARDTRDDLEWVAHAFLCHVDSRVSGEVRALSLSHVLAPRRGNAAEDRLERPMSRPVLTIGTSAGVVCVKRWLSAAGVTNWRQTCRGHQLGAALAARGTLGSERHLREHRPPGDLRAAQRDRLEHTTKEPGNRVLNANRRPRRRRVEATPVRNRGWSRPLVHAVTTYMAHLRLCTRKRSLPRRAAHR